MTCPNCGRGEIIHAGGYGHEPHGETHFDEWEECTYCGQHWDMKDLMQEVEAIGEAPEWPETKGDQITCSTQ